MADAAVADRLEKAGILAVTMTPEEFEKYFRDEAERWTKVYKESGIKLDSVIPGRAKRGSGIQDRAMLASGLRLASPAPE